MKGNEGFEMFSNRIIKGSKILKVDNNDQDRNALNTILKSDGCRVKSTSNARQGINLLRKREFEVVISDFNLPDI